MNSGHNIIEMVTGPSTLTGHGWLLRQWTLAAFRHNPHFLLYTQYVLIISVL